MDNILAIIIGLLTLTGVGILFTSDSSTESPSEPESYDQPVSNEAPPPLTGNPYQDTRIVGGKRKKRKTRRKSR